MKGPLPLATVLNPAVVPGQLVWLLNALAPVFVRTVSVAVLVTLVHAPATSTLYTGSLTVSDRTPDPAGGPGWFAAIVEVEAAELRAGTAPPLVPGMPAEVYVTTGARSALEYLLAPIDLFRRRALREP